jgi:hypothetical protein
MKGEQRYKSTKDKRIRRHSPFIFTFVPFVLFCGYLLCIAALQIAPAETQMDYQVEITEVTQQLIAAARQRTTFRMVSHEIRQLLEAPWAFIRKNPDLRAGGHNVAIYWDKTGAGSIEVGIQIIKPFEETELVVCSAIQVDEPRQLPTSGITASSVQLTMRFWKWCKEKPPARRTLLGSLR